MKLTPKNVRTIITHCLFKEGENNECGTIAKAVLTTMAFHPGRLEEHKADISDLLSQLPDTFMHDKGGGMSFLNACMTRDGEQWGEHRDIDFLICIGVAVGIVSFPFPRDVWTAIPGGMPYFTVTLPPIQKETATA